MTVTNNKRADKVVDKVWIIVPAAGSGRRMGSERPKQYLSLMGETVIEKTLNRLLAVNRAAGITVAISSDDLFFSTLPVAKNPIVNTTSGGSERSDSVLAGLKSLQIKAALSDWVLVHDAARCCIRVDVINHMLSELKDSGVGGILGVPVSDTLKQVNHDSQIESTLDRSQIWQAQTPQLFRYGLLKKALEYALDRQYPITDEASAIELLGYDVKMCMGHYDNIKITHPDDLALAEMLLMRQKERKE
jgi:2-C-methyl-D-erythritol 4-phosphate cytidylyltransferase